MSNSNTFDDAIAFSFVDDLNADEAGFIRLFADEHETTLPAGHPNPQPSPCKSRTYNNFFDLL